MMESKENDYIWLDSVILHTAIHGFTDCLGPVDVNWNRIGNFIVVLIQKYTGDWWYRIFVCADGDFSYERNRIMNPVESDDLQYMYGSFENIYEGGRVVQHLLQGDWIKTFEEAINDNQEMEP